MRKVAIVLSSIVDGPGFALVLDLVAKIEDEFPILAGQVLIRRLGCWWRLLAAGISLVN